MPGMITSRKNEKIRFAVHLSGSASFRKEQGLFFVEGARLCRDAAESDIIVETVFYTRMAGEKYPEYMTPLLHAARESFQISEPVAGALSETRTPQGVFALCKIKPETGAFPSAARGHFLALENLQDPANLGAALRTAEALGISGVFLAGNGCGLTSPKVLRASMGAVFRLPFWISEDGMAQTVRRLNRTGFRTLAAIPNRGAVSVTRMDFSKPSVAVVGNEGNGLTEETIHACSQTVTIPMRGRAESLNASASAAILMWEMMRGASGGGKEP